jgi:hypothetical protein
MILLIHDPSQARSAFNIVYLSMMLRKQGSACGAKLLAQPLQETDGKDSGVDLFQALG